MRLAIPDDRLKACLRDAAASRLADASVVYPDWYMQRWHLFPEGYLSRRGAALYERLIPPLYNQGRDQAVLSAAVARLAASAPARVLDVGCGAGNALDVAARWPAAQWRLAGVDLSPFLLELATERPALARAAAEFVHADASALPWPDASFDAVLAVHVLGHVPQNAAIGILAEVSRVLVPGGRLVTVEHRWHRVPGSPALALASRQLLNGGLIVLREFTR